MIYDVCKKPDKYFIDLTEKQIIISWECILSNGESVFGDYDRPDHAKCWDRFRKYCYDNKLNVTKVKLYMFGQPQHVFWEDKDGLDGFSIIRGVARDQSMGNARDFQFLSVSKLSEECDYISVKKFIWHLGNEIEPLQETRKLTLANVEQLIFRHDSEKIKRPEIQVHLNRGAL